MKYILVFSIFIFSAGNELTAQITEVDTMGVDTQSQEEPVFSFAEVMPKFPGGDEALNNFLANNIKYPTMAREMGIQGKVYASFIVEKDGTITNITIEHTLNSDCDKEVLRVLNRMPKWEPGINKNQMVRVKYKLPVSFVLR